MKTFLKDSKHLTYQEIQLYLSNKISLKKRFRVENHLLDCPLCESAMEGFKHSQNIGEDSLALKKLRNNSFAPETKRKTIVMWPLKIAASFMLLLIPLAVLYFFQPEDIVEKYAGNLSEEFASGNRWITEKSSFQKALLSCENGDYTSCIDHLNDCLKDKPTNSGLNFYLGLAHFGNQDFGKANQYLSTVSKHSSYYEDAYWYSILSQLKTGDKSHVISMLNNYTTKKPNGFYFKEAKELKYDLE